MNTNVSRNDFLFFQNEVFKDIKNLEKKLNEKIANLSSSIDSNKESSDDSYQKFTEKISQIIDMVQSSEERLKIDEQLSSFKKKVDDGLLTNKAKITALEKEINKITFKYDKIFLDNMSVPGVIGTACPFQNLSSFIEYVNKKIKELLIEKTKHNTDMSSYKERLETIIGSFNKQINNIEKQFIEFCNNSFKEYEKRCNDRNNLVEEKVQNMRIENGKYSFDLIQKTNELKIKWDKIQSIQDDIYNRFNEELVKHVDTSNNLCKVFNSQRDEFKLLKSRFTELSEFIKDVRFRNNLYNNQNETEYEKKVKFRNISKRINFNLKQKLDINDKKDNSLDKINEIAPSQNNNENTLNQSFISTENNKTNVNRYRQKSGITLNKPMNLGNVSSTLKNYFNQNKEYKTPKYKNIRIFSKFADTKMGYKSEKEKIKNNLKKNSENSRNQIKKSEKEKDYFSSEDDNKQIKKPILKKRQFLKSARNILKKKTNLILVMKDENDEKNNNEEEKVLNTNQNFVKSSKFLPLIDLNKKSIDKAKTIDTFSIKKSRNQLLNIKLKSIKNKGSKRKSVINEINNNFKIEKLGNNIENKNKKSCSTKDLKELLSDKNNTNNFIVFNTPKGFGSKIPSLSINKIENIINSIINTNNDKNDRINNNMNPKKNYNTKNSQTEGDNVNVKLPKEKIKIKTLDFSNENSLSNNNEADNKVIKKNKFSFLTNPNIKQIPDQNYNTIDTNDISINLSSLNKRINRTNKKMNEVYQDLDIKIDKLYKYVKRSFGELTGRLFYNETHKEKLFNINISPKTIFTTSKFVIPIPEKDKKMMVSKEIDRIIKEKKFYSPKFMTKIDSYKSIVNHIEPFLIKKFKE